MVAILEIVFSDSILNKSIIFKLMINIIKKLFGNSKSNNPKYSEKVVPEKNTVNEIEKPKEEIIWTDSNHGKFIDERDKNVYNVIKIENQIWLADNFRFKSSNGCWAYDNNEFKAKTYGYLYNWDSAKQISPKGWHLPSDEEWITLINFFGGKSIAGKKLKSTTEGSGTNESGFNALL